MKLPPSSPASGPLPFQPSLEPIESLSPSPRNPRQHSQRQVRQIARSIKAFGFNVPILADRNRLVISGHGRLLAARQLGLTHVPVILLDHLSPEQVQAFAIADNRLSDNSSWNDQLLGEIFAELAALDLSFDIEATGFTMGEIDLRIEALELPDAGKPVESDSIDDFELPEGGAPVTRLGDTWQLGRHRIHCGSALDSAAYAALLGEERAAAVFADPPFNVPIRGHVSGRSAGHREFAMASGEMTPAQFTRFLACAFEQMAQHSEHGSLHFICIDWRHLREALDSGFGAYADLVNLCVWVKDKGGMGSLYRSQHELVLVFRHGRSGHRNNVQLGQFGRNRTNVWNYPGANTMSRERGAENVLAMHPTVKPVAMVADALLDCTARGAIVLDPFLGSGTTLLAAERSGRACRGIELDPLYVDLVIRRWQSLSGDSATLESGESFEAIAQQRGEKAPSVERTRLPGRRATRGSKTGGLNG